jgi:hypothetical protein
MAEAPKYGYDSRTATAYGLTQCSQPLAVVTKMASRARAHATVWRANLSKACWSWGGVSAIDSSGRTIWIADAHRGDGKRFIVHADEKLSAFLELERAVCIHLLSETSAGV